MLSEVGPSLLTGGFSFWILNHTTPVSALLPVSRPLHDPDSHSLSVESIYRMNL